MARKRGNRWQADVKLEDGTRRRKGFETKAEAEDFERRALAGVDVEGNVTLGLFIDEQFDALWGDTKAINTHIINARLIKRDLGETTPIIDINERRIDAWISQMKKDGKANGTINRKLAALSKILRRAERHKIIDKRPDIESLPENGGRELVITKEQEKEARAYFEHTGMVLEGALFDFLLYTGCRISEALKLTRSSQQEDGILFADRKNKKVKATNTIVPLVGPAEDAWKTALAFSKAPRPFGDNIEYTTFMRRWALMREHLEVPEEDIPCFIPHMLRHTCCTRLVSGGAPLPKVMKWMGHQSIRTTMRYAHLIPKDLDDISAILLR
nr:site-specific integrase [uncultured Cohaesibacter sp.]